MGEQRNEGQIQRRFVVLMEWTRGEDGVCRWDQALVGT